MSDNSRALIGTIIDTVFSSTQQLHYRVNVFVYFPNELLDLAQGE